MIAAQAASRLVCSVWDTEIRQVRFERGGQQLAQVVNHLVDADHMVVDVPEIRASVLGINLRSKRISRLHTSTRVIPPASGPGDRV
jgi:hypothetical protein